MKRTTRYETALKNLTQTLCKDLRKTVKSCYQGSTSLLFEEINAKYPNLLKSDKEAELLFDDAGRQILAARYLEGLSKQEILEINGETE